MVLCPGKEACRQKVATTARLAVILLSPTNNAGALPLSWHMQLHMQMKTIQGNKNQGVCCEQATLGLLRTLQLTVPQPAGDLQQPEQEASSGRSLSVLRLTRGAFLPAKDLLEAAQAWIMPAAFWAYRWSLVTSQAHVCRHTRFRVQGLQNILGYQRSHPQIQMSSFDSIPTGA